MSGFTANKCGSLRAADVGETVELYGFGCAGSTRRVKILTLRSGGTLTRPQ